MEESTALSKDRDSAVAKAARLSSEAARQAKSLAEAHAQVTAVQQQLKLSVQPEKVWIVSQNILLYPFPNDLLHQLCPPPCNATPYPSPLCSFCSSSISLSRALLTHVVHVIPCMSTRMCAYVCMYVRVFLLVCMRGCGKAARVKAFQSALSALCMGYLSMGP